MTPRRVLRLFASLAGIWAMAIAPTAARAQTTVDDGSFVYQLSGAADGIRLTYDREAFLPFSPIADLRVPSARATLHSPTASPPPPGITPASIRPSSLSSRRRPAAATRSTAA